MLWDNTKSGTIAGWNWLKDQIPEFYGGTKGFQNFGSGQLAMLHGEEAVIPKADFGNLISSFGKTLEGSGIGEG